MGVFVLLVLSGVVHVHGYNYTIDCHSFTRPSGYTIPNTCTPEGDWSHIINRPLPGWYADMKFGIFIHWGVFSVPSYGNEWYWHNYECGNAKVKAFQDNNYGPEWKYPQFADLFHAELYDANEWVNIIKRSGAQYVLPVAKHHDGFCLWDARTTSPGWNAMERGPKRDVLTELYDACQAHNLEFGIYYSQGEWFDDDMVRDAKANFTTTTFIHKKVIPQRKDSLHDFPTLYCGILMVNGVAIFSTRPWVGSLPTGGEGKDIFYTYSPKTSTVYCTTLVWPTNSVLLLSKAHPTPSTTATLLLGDITLKWDHGATAGMEVHLPPPPLGSQWGWVVALTHLA